MIAGNGPEAQPKPMQVLISDDSEIVRLVLRRMLEHDGHGVDTACDGAEAVRMAAQKAYGLILMDRQMPQVSGDAAARAIRKGGGPSAAARIVMMTGKPAARDSAEQEAQAPACPENGETLIKPVTRETLHRLITAAGGAPVVRAAGAAGVTGVAGAAGMAGMARAGQGARPTGDALSAPDQPLLDRDVLCALDRHLPPGQLAAVLAEALAEGDALTARLASAALPDRAQLQAVHRLAGTLAMLGARAMHQALAQLEQTMLAGPDHDITAAAARCAALWPLTRAEVAASTATRIRASGQER